MQYTNIFRREMFVIVLLGGGMIETLTMSASANAARRLDTAELLSGMLGTLLGSKLDPES